MRKRTHDTNYNGYDLSATNKKNEGFYCDILQNLENLLNYVTRRHGRIFFIRFDVRYPADSSDLYPSNNRLFSNFMGTLTRYYKRHGHDPKYLWVREFSHKTGQIHYHVVLLLDSNLIQKGHGAFLAKANELWQRKLGIDYNDGLIQLCKRHGEYGGVKITRSSDDFHQVFAECFKRATYLAKCYSKGESPAYVNEFRCSRIPKEYLS